jgi:hypothetical protein
MIDRFYSVLMAVFLFIAWIFITISVVFKGLDKLFLSLGDWAANCVDFFEQKRLGG